MDEARFCERSRWFMRATTVILAAIIAFAVLYAWVIVRAQLSDPDVLWRLGLSWLPSIFYIWALCTLRGLFAGLADEGLRFQSGLMTSLARIGWALVCGGLTAILTAPVISRLTQPHHLGGFAIFDVPALVLVMLGVALIVLARMVRQALALQAEAGKLRNVLEGFI